MGKCSFQEEDIGACGSSGYKISKFHKEYTGPQKKISWVLKIDGKIIATAKVKVVNNILQAAPLPATNVWASNSYQARFNENIVTTRQRSFQAGNAWVSYPSNQARSNENTVTSQQHLSQRSDENTVTAWQCLLMIGLTVTTPLLLSLGPTLYSSSLTHHKTRC